MKYEVRKQIISKVIILSLLATFEAVFLIGIIIRNMDCITIANGVIKVIVTMGMFYVALEPAIAYENDLGKKQGYLLFMTPNSTALIIGAKLIAGALQLLLLFSLLVGLFTINDALLSGVYGTGFHQLDEVFNAFGDVGFGFSEFLITGLFLLFMWADITTLAFFSISISYSIFAKGKLNSFISILLFIIIFIAEIVVVGMVLIAPFKGVGTVELDFLVVSGLIFIVPAILNYIGATRMLDKKVSL
jgi:hypothetical protein